MSMFSEGGGSPSVSADTTGATDVSGADPSAAGTGASFLGDLFNNAVGYVSENPVQSAFLGTALGSQIYGMANRPKPPKIEIPQFTAPTTATPGTPATSEALSMPGTQSSPIFSPKPMPVIQGGQGLMDPLKRRQGGMGVVGV